MSGKKKQPNKKQPNKKKAVEKKIARKESKRKLIPFTDGKLPSVSKSMPQAASGIPSVSKSMPPAASAVPLVSKEIPLVSKPISLVSAKPNISIPRFWENKAGRKKWDMSRMPINRHRKVTRPTDIGLFKALGEIIVSPVMGAMKMVKGIASPFKTQAEEEREPKAALEQELLELKMHREMNEISEEDYKRQEMELKKRIKDIEKETEVNNG